ncbi:MAG: tetratricopeptide repeat protein, partial [Candidatus Omnitrophica bacterium]|nr:tetratricopeptide repeat protein [Candidatus Omnitrophota bacterium]
MQRVIIFFVFIILLFIPICAEASVEDYLCDLARQYYQKGDYSQVLHEYKKALILDPNNEEARTFVSELESKGISSEKVFDPSFLPSRNENTEETINRNLEINKALLDTQ